MGDLLAFYNLLLKSIVDISYSYSDEKTE